MQKRSCNYQQLSRNAKDNNFPKLNQSTSNLLQVGNKMSAITEEGWQKAFKAVREQFEINNLLPEQENSLREFLGGQNIFVNLPMRYGKSLIFQCLPIAVVITYGRPDSTSK